MPLQPTTPLPWVAKRDWEGYYEPDADEAEAYKSRPFTRIVSMTENEPEVVCAHDMFKFKEGDAEFITEACNSHSELVTALKAVLRKTVNADSAQAYQVHQEARQVLAKLGLL